MNYVLYRDPVLSVGISVSNMEKSVLYWKDLLGMQVVQVRVRPLSEYIRGVYNSILPPPWGGEEIKGHKRGEGKYDGGGKGRREEEGKKKERRRVILSRKLKSNLVRYVRTSLHPWKNL